MKRRINDEYTSISFFPHGKLFIPQNPENYRRGGREMLQKANVSHGHVQTPTERQPFFSKFKQKVALGLTLLTVGQLAGPVVFRKISPFAENAIVRAEEKEELKSILEKEPPKTFTVREKDLEVTFTNSSCVLDVTYKGKKFTLDIKERNDELNKEKMEFVHCYKETVLFPEYPTIGVLVTYKKEGRNVKTGVFIVGMKFGHIKEIIDGAVKIEKIDSEKIKVTGLTGFVIFSAKTGEYLLEETIKASLKESEK